MRTMTRALIGREHPAGLLLAEIGRAVASHGGLVLVTGEAGIGKTTLVTAAAEDARALGALVLSGSCWDSENAPGYWPWVQVIRALRRVADDRERAEAEAAAGGSLSILLGEAALTEQSDDFRLYDGVTTALVSLSQHRPVVVVLDDLHWADAASLRLLEFAAQHTWFERLLFIGTYRDVEVEAADHPLRPLIGQLLVRATTVTLTGLGPDEVAALMAHTVGREPEADLVTEVHRRTGGNPFFVEQTARLWHSGGSVTAITPGVRDALRRRLSLLPDPVVRLLATAAVLGREFHRQVLAAVAGAPVPQVDRQLDAAAAARLVVSLGAGRFAFAHDLVRETLYDSIGEAGARAQHAVVVRTVAQSAALTGRMVPADLARHAYLAGAELEPSSVVDHLLAAARDASRRLANDESVGHLRRAHQLAAGDQSRRRVVIALELAGALRHGDRPEEAWRTYREAVDIARALADDELLARVALSVYGTGDWAAHAPYLTDLLAEVHTRRAGGPPPAAPPQGAVSAERLARELTIWSAMVARRGDDDEALGFSLWARHNAIWGPGSAEERVGLTEELMAVARRTSDREMEYFAASFRWVALLESGDPRYLEQFHAFETIAQRADVPLSRMALCTDRAIIATLRGAFAEAARHHARLVESVDDRQHSHFTYMTQHLRWSLLLSQGRFDELGELYRQAADTGNPYARLLEALAAVEAGDHELAASHVADLVDLAEPYDRFVAPLWARLLAQTAAAVRDPGLLARARAALAPYAGGWAVSMYGCDISGPIALWSGVVDAAEGRWDAAIEAFTAAYRSADALKARPWSVTARWRLAGALRGRAGPGDAEAATTLLAEVAKEAAGLGMRQLADASTVDSPRRMANEFRLDGQVWSLSMAGRTVHMPDTKGLRDLFTLIGSPGKDISSVELLNPEGGEVVLAARRLGGDVILDEAAKASYRRRLVTLDEEIDRVTALADDRKAAELDRERQALLNELRAAAGLAGRDRRLGDESERARKTVTARIRDTLRKLDERHPELAEHLRTAVSTGITCRYQPDGEITWRRYG